MNLKNIINYFFLICFIILTSCKSIDILSKKQSPVLLDFDNIENNFVIDINYNKIMKDNHEDYYDNLIIDNNFEFKKINNINTFQEKIEEINPLISFIHKDQFISLNRFSELKIYDLNNFDIIKSISLDISVNKKKYYPSSIARIENYFFSTFTNGKVIKFDLEGKIYWEKNLNDLIKTPIKIIDGNLIILTTNKIFFIDSLTSETIWHYTYDNNLPNQVLGGKLLDYNHLLFFILPNTKIGEIDIIFGEKNNNLFSNINLINNINNSFDIINIYKGIISYFDQNNFLTSIDIKNNNLLLNNFEINEVFSSIFFNNSLFVINHNLFLKSYNILNGNLYWKIDLNNILKKNQKIVKIASFNDFLYIFIDSGKVLELNSKNGEIISIKDIKINKILNIRSTNSYLLVDQLNGKTTIFK